MGVGGGGRQRVVYQPISLLADVITYVYQLLSFLNIFSKKFHNHCTMIINSLDFAGWDQRNVEFCDLRDKLILLSGGFKERVVVFVLVIGRFSLTTAVLVCIRYRGE